MPKSSWAKKLMSEASDAKSVMRIHALSLLAFADGIEDEIAEALQNPGAHLTYTLQVVGESASADSQKDDK